MRSSSSSSNHRNFKKRIFYTTPEVRRAFYILAAIFNKQPAVYAGEACKRWLNSDFASLESGTRQEPINIYIDSCLDIDIEAKLGRNSKLRSALIYQCIKREVYTRIATWGCKTTDEFISLMTSKTPLKFIEELNNRNKQVAA